MFGAIECDKEACAESRMRNHCFCLSHSNSRFGLTSENGENFLFASMEDQELAGKGAGLEG